MYYYRSINTLGVAAEQKEVKILKNYYGTSIGQSMKKIKQKEGSTPDFNFGDFGLDQNYKKQTHLNNVQDLVTQKEKQIHKKQHQLGTRHKRDDEDDEIINDYQFDQEVQMGKNGIRYAEKNQADNQSKEQLLETINRMMAKNKINNKTAFDVPILSVDDFAIYDESEGGEIAWSKMSCILENDYKIYGVRVDAIAEFVKKMSDSLGRKNTEAKDELQNENAIRSENTGQTNQKATKYTELVSTEVKNNLVLHLQKNSENLNINFRTKLVMRKDPLFERTSRKFDHTSYSSLFMNTLVLAEGLQMQINATDESIQDKRMEQRNQQQKKFIIELQIKNSKAGSQMHDANDETISNRMQMIQSSIKNGCRAEIKLNRNINKFRQGLNQLGVKLQPNENGGRQRGEDYQKIVDMILKGQLKSAFEVGMQVAYSESESQISERSQHPISPAQRPPLESNCININNTAMEVKSQQQQSDELQEHKAKGNHKTTKTQKIQKKFKRIKEVISLKQLVSDPDLVKTRKKKLNTDIKNIIETERKALAISKIVERELFDPTVKERFQQVLKKQKIIKIQANLYEDVIETNVNLPILSTFHKQHSTSLRPLPTTEDLSREKASQHQQMSVTLYPSRQYGMGQAEPKAQQQSSEESEPKQASPSQRCKKNETITTVKQNMYSIVKINKTIDLNWLRKEYELLHGYTSSSTLFIAMLHLANQKFIKCKQHTNKNFTICLFDL